MEEKLQRFLEGRHVASFGCTRPDGTVHVTPVWYLWEVGTQSAPSSQRYQTGVTCTVPSGRVQPNEAT